MSTPVCSICHAPPHILGECKACGTRDEMADEICRLNDCLGFDEDHVKAVAEQVWHTSYPDRRPWHQLEESTRIEWCRVIRITLSTARQSHP